MQMGQGLQQGLVHIAFALLQAPALGLQRQGDQGGKAAQGAIQNEECRQQQQHHHVQGQVQPVGRPEQHDRALVVARKQGASHGQAEQTDKPQCSAHAGPPRSAAGSGCGQRAQRVVDGRLLGLAQMRLDLQHQGLGALRAAGLAVEVLGQGGVGTSQVGACRVILARQQAQAGIEQRA
jgi:hypothetical protein